VGCKPPQGTARCPIARCQEENRASQQLRPELLERFSPAALAQGNSSLAREAARYTSFLSRLWPRWWTLKRHVASWYRDAVPSAQRQLEDLARLGCYHRHLNCCQEVRQHYAQDLLLNGSGQPDWEHAGGTGKRRTVGGVRQGSPRTSGWPGGGGQNWTAGNCPTRPTPSLQQSNGCKNRCQQKFSTRKAKSPGNYPN